MQNMKRETRNAKQPQAEFNSWFRVSYFAFRVSSALAFLLSFPIMATCQMDPDVPATAPTTQPQEQELKLVTPTVDKDQHQISLPVNFWNEKLTGWVETALSGLPSDFSHETIIAATVTRATMVDSLHQAGFHDADAWVSNVKDFPKIRGDKALI